MRGLCPVSGESPVQHGLIMSIISGAIDGATSVETPICEMGPPL